MVGVIGVPVDENSSFLRGSAGAPAKIREILHSGSSNWGTETGPDLDSATSWKDLGDMKLPALPGAMAEIRRQAADLLDSGMRMLFLGGDHSVSFPLISAYAQKYPDLNVIHLDAHADLYHNFEDNPHSHASPFARLMEEGNVARLIQIGIRTLNHHLREQAKKFRVEVIEMRQLKDAQRLHFDGPVYLSLDLDCLDPAFAPGVSHHEPGGMTTRQVLEIIQGFHGRLVGADIVEYNPLRDLNNVTAMTAGKFYKELVARLIRDST